MKNAYKITALSLLLALSGTYALAQTDGTDTATAPAPEKPGLLRERVNEAKSQMGEFKNQVRGTASTTRAEMEKKAGDIRAQIETRKNEVKTQIQARRGEIVKAMGERTIARLNAALARLDTLTERITSRIAKMDEAKLDTTKAKADLEIAKAKITEAKAKVAEVSASIGTMTTGTANTDAEGNIIRESLQGVKDLVRTATETIKAGHQALVVVITDIKSSYGNSSKAGTANE
jgi:chromosome segregation ATPase